MPPQITCASAITGKHENRLSQGNAEALDT